MQTSQARSRLLGFTLIELLVVISIIALLIGILLPALSNARTAARKLASNTQIRGIQQAFFTHGVDNGGRFAGVDNTGGSTVDEIFTGTDRVRTVSGGNSVGGHFVGRYAILLEGGYLTGDYLVSPGETDERVEAWDPNVPDNFYSQSAIFWSYALPILRSTAAPFYWQGRVQAWSIEGGSSAVVVSDRLTNAVNPSAVPAEKLESLWSTPGDGWVGGVSFGDNHVISTESALIEGTDYGSGVTALDNLFSKKVCEKPPYPGCSR